MTDITNTTSRRSLVKSTQPKDPDLVDRIFEYLSDDPALRALSRSQMVDLQAAVRAEFSGERCYIKGRPATARQELVASVLALFNGRNTREVARRLQVSRHTVLRVVKQSGHRRTFAGPATADTGTVSTCHSPAQTSPRSTPPLPVES